MFDCIVLKTPYALKTTNIEETKEKKILLFFSNEYGLNQGDHLVTILVTNTIGHYFFNGH